MERLGPFRQTLSSQRVPFQNGRSWPCSKFHFEQAALPDETVPRRSAVPMSILIVDDEETPRELYVTVATQAGLRATAVPSAEQALELLEHSAIDILLADLKLPRMGGLELLRRVSELYPQ